MNCADRSVAETLKQSGSAGNNHYSAEQRTMPTRMEKKIYQQNNEKFLARFQEKGAGMQSFVKHPSKDTVL